MMGITCHQAAWQLIARFIIMNAFDFARNKQVKLVSKNYKHYKSYMSIASNLHNSYHIVVHLVNHLKPCG